MPPYRTITSNEEPGLLKNPDLAIPAIVYSLWMYASAFIAVYYGRKKAALAK
jgi:BASS family bile acid:Na+ symporter